MGCRSFITAFILTCIVLVMLFVIVICGLILLGFGIAVLDTHSSLGKFAIAVGAIIFLFGLSGCYGTIKETGDTMPALSLLLSIFFILQMVLGTLAFVAMNNEDNLRSIAHERANEKFGNYFKDTSNEREKNRIDNYQQMNECCGVNGKDSWPTLIVAVPASCYKDEEVSEANLYKRGCSDALREEIANILKFMGTVAMISAVVELVGAIFTFMFRNQWKSEATLVLVAVID